MGSATRVPNSKAASSTAGCHGVCRVLGSIDHTICSVLSKLRPQRETTVALTPNSLRIGHRDHLPQGSAMLRRSSRLVCGELGQDTRAIVAFAADHQLPGDARDLIGQRYRGELGRLALEKLDQPGPGMSASSLDLLDHGGGADDQHAAQRIVTGASDYPEPRLAGARVILRCQSEPSREVPPGSECV